MIISREMQNRLGLLFQQRTAKLRDHLPPGNKRGLGWLGLLNLVIMKFSKVWAMI